MGQQQLLLLVLAAVIVGTGILLGVNMFQDNAAQANLDAVTQDCLTLASRAQAWYRRPLALEGGGQAFTNLALDNLNFPTNGKNENGTYTLAVVNAGEITITGDGLEDGDATAGNVKVLVTVTNNTVTTDVQNR